MSSRAGATGNGHVRPDPSMRDWIIVSSGTVYVLGKLLGDDEEHLRKEMKETALPPLATLFPAYSLDVRVHLMLDSMNQLRSQMHMDAKPMEWWMRGAMASPWYATLSLFSFCSEQTDACRKHLCELVEQMIRAQSARDSNLVLPG